MCIWLIVEDNPGDVQLVKTVLAESALPVELYFASDGQVALAFLRQEGAHATAPRPDLILLDINLPVKNGLEVLAEVKKDGALKRIPVVMLSASDSEDDISLSYDLGANAYLTKPSRLETYHTMMKALFEVWCDHPGSCAL
jgi:chemotaxis family two-component system response regulator Rcp1